MLRRYWMRNPMAHSTISGRSSQRRSRLRKRIVDRIEQIAQSAQRLDAQPRRLEALAQAMDVDVDRLRAHRFVERADAVADRLLADRRAGLRHQELEHRM